MISPSYNEKIINEQLINLFARGKGGMIGSSGVVSRKAHGEAKTNPGLVLIHMTKDAGQTYLQKEEKDECIHIYLLHSPSSIDFFYLANHLKEVIVRFTTDHSWHLPPKQEKIRQTISGNIHLGTEAGTETILDLSRRKRILGTKHENHIKILANLTPEFYSLIGLLSTETETYLSNQGVKLRPVNQVIHIHKKVKKANHT